MGEIKGKAGIGVINDEAQKVQASLLKDAYEHHEFTAPGGGYADVSLATIAPTAFATITRAHTCIIRSAAGISFKFNSASNHAISLSASEASFSTQTLEIESVFFTVPAAGVVKILLV
jgi:hypothetical protein